MIHRLNDRSDLQETVDAEMTTLLHELKDFRELLEVLALARPKRIRPEERNNDLVEISKPPHDVSVQRLAMVIPSCVDVDPPASEVVE